MAAAPAVAWGKAGLFISRGLAPLPPPRPSKGAPPFPPSCSPAARTRAEIIAGDGGRALVPRACGAVGCARGARPCIPAVSAVCLPASGRARSACRAVCAVRALRRASPPSSGGQARVVKGVQSSSVSAWGTGTRLRRSDRRLTAAIWPKPRKKAPALTKSGGLFVAHPVGAVWVTQSGAGDVVHVVPPTVGAYVVEFTSAPHAAQIKFSIRRALVGQDHQADLIKARKAGRDGCPFVRRPLRFCHAPAPFRAVLIDHTQYTPAEGGGASTFLSFFALKNRSPRSSTRRLSRKRSAPRLPGL